MPPAISAPGPLSGTSIAGIAQLGERQTEDLKVAGSIPAAGIRFASPKHLCFPNFFFSFFFFFIPPNPGSEHCGPTQYRPPTSPA